MDEKRLLISPLCPYAVVRELEKQGIIYLDQLINLTREDVASLKRIGPKWLARMDLYMEHVFYATGSHVKYIVPYEWEKDILLNVDEKSP